MKGLDPIIKELTLPLMPATTRELRQLLQLHATRTPQLQKVLLTDPGAVVAVFRELEKMRPGASDLVADAGHAVSMLGMEALRRLVEDLPELPAREHPAGLHPAMGYSQAAHAAFYARAICDRKGINRVDEVATAALLQNPAMLALWVSDPESALRARNAVRDGVAADVAFGAELGEPLEDANRDLAGAWSLPGLVRQALGDWDDFSPRPQVVRLADEIAQTTSLGWRSEHTDTITRVLADFLDLEQDAACAWLHQRAVDAARHFRDVDYPLPGFELALLPGDHQDDDDDHAVPEFGRRTPPAEQPGLPRQPDLHTTMAAVMKRMRSDTGTTRVVFAMLDRERSHLRTRLALGGDRRDGIRRLDVDLKGKTLFGALMRKPQSVWLNPSNAARYEPYLPDSLRALLHDEGAFMMSLFIGDRALGLLYADGAALDEPGYRRFRELCREAVDALSGRTAARPRAGGSA